MPRKEELQNANEKFKNALESQLDEMKNNLDKVGKTALIVAGGLLGAYLLSNAISGSSKKKNKKEGKEKKSKARSVIIKENLLSSTLKEQAIIFLLGIAAERLTSFLKDLDNKTDTDEEK